MKNPSRKNPIIKKSWQDLRDTGLFLFLNQFLQIFGWVIVIESMDGVMTGAYPARTDYRGFSERYQSEEGEKLADFMKKNATQLKKECKLNTVPCRACLLISNDIVLFGDLPLVHSCNKKRK